jgi:hypothetical protein
MVDAPRMTGAGLIEIDEQLVTVGMDPGPGLSIAIYDIDLNLVDQSYIEPFSEEIIHYWPSRIKQIGNHYLIATMGRDPADEFPLDTGDLYVVVVDLEFNTKEWQQISFNNSGDDGGMRPWFDIHEDQVILGYDKQNSLYLFSMTIDLDAFSNNTEPSSEPSAEPAIEPSSEPGSEAEPNPPKSSGCGSSNAMLSFIPLFLWFRQKSRD